MYIYICVFSMLFGGTYLSDNGRHSDGRVLSPRFGFGEADALDVVDVAMVSSLSVAMVEPTIQVYSHIS